MNRKADRTYGKYQDKFLLGHIINYQLWIHSDHSDTFVCQRLDYMHHNPVHAGFAGARGHWDGAFLELTTGNYCGQLFVDLLLPLEAQVRALQPGMGQSRTIIHHFPDTLHSLLE